jgi:ribosomal protein S18 acetylase RimI-like enzyme
MIADRNVHLRVGRDLPFDQLLALYEAVGWKAYTSEGQRGRLQQAIQNSTYVVSAWCGERLIGLARGLSDDVSIFYLQDILIHPDFQRRGIGKQLMDRCLERFDHVRTKVLLTDDQTGQLEFYQACGYKNTRHLNKVRLNTFVQIAGVRLE